MILSETQKALFEAVLEIEGDVSYNPTVEALAERIGVSEVYFRRAFRSLFDESFKQYYLRVRLHRAAVTLKTSDLSVIQIALDVGFETHAGFTKAFTRFYGKPPQRFREEAGTAPYVRYLDSTADLEALARQRARRMVVRIEEVPEKTYAATRNIGGVFSMVQAWSGVMRWVQEDPGLKKAGDEGGPAFIGIHHDDWDHELENKYRYDACVELLEGYVPQGVATVTVPGGPVAMYEFDGSLKELDKAWWSLANEWLPTSGYQYREHFVYDRYDPAILRGNAFQRVLKTALGIRCTLCVPIEKAWVSNRKAAAE